MATRPIKRPRGSEDPTALKEEQEDDQLLRMDPSLMTERQQLAFLLRTTAQKALDNVQLSSEKVVDEAGPSVPFTKKHGRVQRTPRGRRYPLKSKCTKRPSAVNLKRPVTSRRDEEKEKGRERDDVAGSDDDVSQMNEARRSFEDREPRCALCCDYETAHEASFSDVLFLCPACDQKYPTQWALGRRACMT